MVQRLYEEVFAEQTLELHMLKKSMFDGRATTNGISRIREISSCQASDLGRLLEVLEIAAFVTQPSQVDA